MAPPIPTLSPAQFLATQDTSYLERCPLKELAQYECIPKQRLPISGRKARSDAAEAPSRDLEASSQHQAQDLPIVRTSPKDSVSPKGSSAGFVCTEFIRYFRRCADVGLGPNVEVTSLMGVKRPAYESVESAAKASVEDDG